MATGEAEAPTPQSTGGFFDEEHAVEEATEQFLSFRLGTEWYGLSIRDAREVIRPSAITYLPSAPAQVAGVINLRGDVVSVTDPKRIFGLPAIDATESRRIVLIESGAAKTGLLVDEMGGVINVPVSRLEPPLATLEPAQAVFIQHTCRVENRLLAILKAESLVTALTQGQAAERGTQKE